MHLCSKQMRPLEEGRSLTVPAWLLQVFVDPPLVAAAKGDFTQLGSKRLLPFFTPYQLYWLSLLLDFVQRQVVAHLGLDPLELLLDVQEWKENPGTGTTHKLAGLVALLPQLGGMKFLAPLDKEQSAALYLFKNEKWINSEQGLVLQLQLDSVGPELACGYLSGPAELTRVLNGSAKLKKVLSTQPPLCLSRALWRDLEETEYRLLLHLLTAEQATREHGKKSSGLLTLPIRSFALGREQDLPLSFPQKIAILQRFAKKLHLHGYLRHSWEDAYRRNQGAAGNALETVWQIVLDNQLSALHHQQLEAINSRFTCSAWTEISNQYSWLFLFSAGISEAMCRNFTIDIARVVSQQQSPRGRNKGEFAVIDGNVLVDASFLFIEWSLRQQPGHYFPLPASFAAPWQGVSLGCVGDNAEVLANKYRLFVDKFNAVQENTHALSHESLVTLMSTKSQQSTLFRNQLEKLRQKYNNQLSSHEKCLSLPVATDAPPPAAVAASLAALQPPGEEASSGIRSEAKVHYTGKKVRLLLAAKEEKHQGLAKIKATSQEKYHSLVTNYFNSLELPSQQIVLNMKKRLPPQQFEHHLMKRLARFIADNPDYK